jgi:hypothetical protein
LCRVDPRVKILKAGRPPWYVCKPLGCMCVPARTVPATGGPTRVKMRISTNPSDFDGPFEIGTGLFSRRVEILIDQILLIDMS